MHRPDDSAPPTPDALRVASLVVTAGRPPRSPGAAVNPGIELSSTFVGWGAPTAGQPMYGRVDNATWAALEEVLSTLEGVGGAGTVFSSGMAAAAAVLALVPVGGRVVVPDAAYNTVLELAEDLHATGRVELTCVDITDTAAVTAAVAGAGRPASLLWLESPTNPLLDVADLPALCSAAQRHGCRVVVDNTFATPLLQQPLRLGADVVVHSVTKYLSGHSDVLLGATVSPDPEVTAALRRHRRLSGAIPGPVETWLAVRGVRTLAVRVQRAQQSAAILAERLVDHPGVQRVRYPGLGAARGRAAAQMTGFGAMVAIEVRGGQVAADRLVEAVRLWLPATSLGGVESSLERRRRQPNEPATVPDNLVRLSVGIEDVEDLWVDLDQGLRRGTGH